jgi:cysteinyl-tRNA synthetase
LDRLYTALKNVPAEAKGMVDWSEPHAKRFKAAMDDDFNTPEAMAVLFDLANEVNRNKSVEAATQLKGLGGVLGLLQEDPIERSQRPRSYHVVGSGGMVIGGSSEVTLSYTDASVNLQIEARNAAKKAKNFAEADRIRKELLAAGIVLEDSAAGTTWRRA